MTRELIALIIAGICAVAIVEGCERAAERRAQRRHLGAHVCDDRRVVATFQGGDNEVGDG